MNGKRDDMNYSCEDIERVVFDAMRAGGWILPQTPEDVLRAEEELAESPVELPKSLAGPFALPAAPRGLVRLGGQLASPRDVNLEQSLSQAAREGGEIPLEVREQMQKDREAAENEDE